MRGAGGFLLWFFMMAIFCPGNSGRNEVLSSWSSTPVIVNGVEEEWEQADVCFEKKYAIIYGFKNDENNLYILFQFKDLRYLSSIDKTGMVIWLSAENSKKKDCGIRFLKKKIPAETYLHILTEQGKAPGEEEKEKIRREPFHPLFIIQFLHKTDNSSGVVDDQAYLPARFRETSTDERVTYEFGIPFPGEKNLAICPVLAPGQILHVGFEWGGLTEEMKKERLRRLQEKAEQQGAPDARIEEVLRRERTLDTEFNVPSSYLKKYTFWVRVRLAREG